MLHYRGREDHNWKNSPNVHLHFLWYLLSWEGRSEGLSEPMNSVSYHGHPKRFLEPWAFPFLHWWGAFGKSDKTVIIQRFSN